MNTDTFDVILYLVSRIGATMLSERYVNKAYHRYQFNVSNGHFSSSVHHLV